MFRSIVNPWIGIEEQPGDYRYTQFCEYYRRWCKKRRISMRQIHRAGEKTFVDYSGKQPRIYGPQTGESQPVELFVGVLGASSYTYAEATATQQLPDFLASQSRMVEFFGGVSELLVPDQLRSAVSDPCRARIARDPQGRRPQLEIVVRRAHGSSPLLGLPELAVSGRSDRDVRNPE